MDTLLTALDTVNRALLWIASDAVRLSLAMFTAYVLYLLLPQPRRWTR